MKKRILALALLLALAVLLTACGGGTDSVSGRGSTKDAKVNAWSSDLFTDDDINKAVKAVFSAFEKDFAGCRMTDISYAGDEMSREAGAAGYDDTLVLDTSFFAEACSDGTYVNGSSYLGWMWILGRNGGGSWEIVKNGY